MLNLPENSDIRNITNILKLFDKLSYYGQVCDDIPEYITPYSFDIVKSPNGYYVRYKNEFYYFNNKGYKKIADWQYITKVRKFGVFTNHIFPVSCDRMYVKNDNGSFYISNLVSDIDKNVHLLFGEHIVNILTSKVED